MRILVLAVLLAGSFSAHGYTIYYGAGTNSCGKWVEERKDRQNWRPAIAWIQGWVSAAGYYDAATTLGYNASGDLFRTDVKAMTAWVDNYCRQNPSDLIRDSAKALVIELAKRAE